MGEITILSPGATFVTPSPTASTSPAASCPSTTGNDDASRPSIVNRSEWQIPQWLIRTRTWPALGSATSTSSTTARGWSTACRRAARISGVRYKFRDGGGSSMTGTLDGLRVLDLTAGIAGPIATMLLADQGAAVTKIEPPTGDHMHPAAGYRVWNRGKRSAVLDLSDVTDRERLLALASRADVLVE